MKKRSLRYLADLGRDPPAICRSREDFFHKFDFDTVLPASKEIAVCNIPASIDLNRELPATVFFAALGNMYSCLAAQKRFLLLKGLGP